MPSPPRTHSLSPGQHVVDEDLVERAEPALLVVASEVRPYRALSSENREYRSLIIRRPSMASGRVDCRNQFTCGSFPVRGRSGGRGFVEHAIGHGRRGYWTRVAFTSVLAP